MRKILLSLTLVAVSAMSMAQSARQSGPSNSANFFVTTTTEKGQERVYVGCTLSEPPITTSLNMYIAAWEPLMLTAKIMNDNSEMVMNWAPTKIDKQYRQQFDISNLVVGKYHMEIYGPDGKKVHTLDFNKEAATGNPSSSSSR